MEKGIEEFAYVPFPGILYKRLGKLSTDEKAQILEQIYYYYIDSTEPEEFVSVAVELTFELLKPFLDKHKKTYIQRCKAGKKGGAPTGNKNATKNNRKTTENQPKNNRENKQKTNKNNQDKDKDKDNLYLSLDKYKECGSSPVGERPTYKEASIFALQNGKGYEEADNFIRMVVDTNPSRTDWTNWQQEFLGWCSEYGY